MLYTAVTAAAAFMPSHRGLGPLLNRGSRGCVRTRHGSVRSDDSLNAALLEELKRRGLQTALEELANDGPSAFRDPAKIIEYLMVSLQHGGEGGVAEAFRFAAREPGKTSFVSGMALSDKRVSWRTAKFIGGYVSGKALTLEEFSAEVKEHYDWLIGCTAWAFAVTHPVTFEPLARTAEKDFLREYVLLVDDRPVQISMFYDWGCWCYLVWRIDFLDGEAEESYLATASADGDALDEGGRVRDRGGSL